MQITADLRLAFPIRWSENDGNLVPLVWAYHTPISREIFETNYRIIAVASTALLAKNVASSVLPIATLTLKDAGRQDAREYGLPDGMTLEAGGTAASLLAEMKRLTLVLAPGASGYEMLMVDAAIARGTIDADDWLEAEAALVFFTCGFLMTPRRLQADRAALLASALRGSITSSLPMDFAASLQTSTIVAATPEPPAADIPEVPQ